MQRYGQVIARLVDVLMPMTENAIITVWFTRFYFTKSPTSLSLPWHAMHLVLDKQRVI